MVMVGSSSLVVVTAVFVLWLLPIILGFTAVRADADRNGQPGWLWAVLTIPFGWLAILIYAAIRAATGGTRA